MTHQPRIEEIDTATCRRLLADHRFGRVGFVDDHGPVIFPVNYATQGDDVFFRTDPGTKLLAADEGRSACFEIDDVDEKRRFGWNVLVRGRLSRVQEPDELQRLEEALMEPFPGGSRPHVVRLTPESVSGRRIPLPADAPAEWFEAPDLGHLWYGQDASDLMG